MGADFFLNYIKAPKKGNAILECDLRRKETKNAQKIQGIPCNSKNGALPAHVLFFSKPKIDPIHIFPGFFSPKPSQPHLDIPYPQRCPFHALYPAKNFFS